MTSRATTDAATCSFPIEMAWVQLLQLFAAVNRARLPRELTYRGSTRLKHHRGSFRLSSAVPQRKYFCSCSIDTFCSINSPREHACLQKVFSPLPPALRYQWRPLQLHYCASFQAAYLCAYSKPRRNRLVRLLLRHERLGANTVSRRVGRTASEYGIRTTTLFTDPDARSQHALSSPYAVNLGDPSAYLDGDRIIQIAKEQGCQGIHPGYGFVRISVFDNVY